MSKQKSRENIGRDFSDWMIWFFVFKKPFHFVMVIPYIGTKICYYLLFLLANWEETCLWPIRSLFIYYHNKFLSQNNVRKYHPDDMKRFKNTLFVVLWLAFRYLLRNIPIRLISVFVLFVTSKNEFSNFTKLKCCTYKSQRAF